MAKTSEYTKRAIDNYRNKFDMLQLRIPKESKLKERIKSVYGSNVNSRILELIESDLKKYEATEKNSPDSIVFECLNITPELEKEIKEKIQQPIIQQEQMKAEGKIVAKDRLSEKLEQLRRDNKSGKLTTTAQEKD